MERVMAVHTVKKDNKDMAATLAESSFNATDYNPQPPCKSVSKPPSDMRGEIVPAMSPLGAMTKADVEAVVVNHLTKWTNVL